MARLIQIKDMEEGEIFCKWLDSRLIRNNQNILGVELGATGSGKSYRDLRKAELWYDYHFNKKFPVENICFGIKDILERITSGKLKKGEILIFEEAGANLGSLDFQNKMSKMFTYVLQSFRSMNIGIFFNLPYLSMLNKTARMLLHYSSESLSIDRDEKTNMCKLFIHQVNQHTGQIFRHTPKVIFNGAIRKVKAFRYGMPSPYLVHAYESMKQEYLSKSTKEYLDKIKAQEDADKPKRVLLTPPQLEVYKLNQEGLNQTEIGKKLGKKQSTISELLKLIAIKGYRVKSPKK